MPKVKVHSITVFFANHSSQEFDPDYIASLRVENRQLTVTAEPTPPILELMGQLDSSVPVNEVEFCYRAGNHRDYRTRVRAGVHGGGDPDAADEIYAKAPKGAVKVFPARPVVIPAQDIVAGATFAVVAHGPQERLSMSADLEVGWHREDCTWFYPY